MALEVVVTSSSMLEAAVTAFFPASRRGALWERVFSCPRASGDSTRRCGAGLSATSFHAG